MDQFMTTYRKDYLWPYIRSFGQKLIEPPLTSTGFDPKCPCRCYPPAPVPDQHHLQYTSPQFSDPDKDWSRLGPMGPLIDPKLYPAQIGKSPETNTMRENQPNMFLNKLQQKYPFLFEILQTHPAADLENKVNFERLRTTYQVDYCKVESQPPDELLRARGVEGFAPGSEPLRKPEEPYKQNQKGQMSFSAMAGMRKTQQAAKGAEGKKAGGGGGGGGGDASTFVPVKTEYQDGISRIGDYIIREKLHSHTKTY